MLGLYIHIPFCKRKCFYCDFVSIEYLEELADNYLKALQIESLKYKNEKIDTIYIGGGTPSVLSVVQLEKLISLIKLNFDISNIQEYTIELNPESTTKEKLEFLYNSNISRISFGLQSIFDDNLNILGRLHNYEKFKSVYYCAKEVGFNNINIDLMYGIPNQNLQKWADTLKEVINLDSQHISLYPLTIEKNTLFYEKNIEPDTDLQAKMYNLACTTLKKNNFQHYEISNWAKENKYSRHNKLYWQNQKYIGLGTSAASYYNRYRYKNNTNVIQYIENLFNKKNIVTEKEYITDELYKEEKIMLELRLNEGVDLKYFKDKKDVLDKYIMDKMLVVINNKVKFTEQALFISNTIISDLL